ncbi:MAG: PBECR2 nuclease fold domain-containing protein [Aerococcus sp.]|nr:PBECR2 nuclease fold domain-containing protein [Aerococcus sp.]
MTQKVKKLLCITAKESVILLDEPGLLSHLKKRKHSKAMTYLPNIQDIIDHPDYIGTNPRVKATSVEYVKKLKDNMLVAVKLDLKRHCFYVASMYDITDAKLRNRIKSGRLIHFDTEDE